MILGRINVPIFAFEMFLFCILLFHATPQTGRTDLDPLRLGNEDLRPGEQTSTHCVDCQRCLDSMLACMDKGDEGK